MSIQLLHSRWRGQSLFAAMITLAAISIGGLTGLPAAAQTDKPINATPVVPTATLGPARLQRTENFLVLGADVPPGSDMMRTDSIMLVSIDYDTRQVGVLSIPGDLWVGVPGWGADRIQSAYSLGDYTKYRGGGRALAKVVVEKTLGVPIQHVVLIKIDGLARLVDALGGVTVRLDCPLYEQAPDPTNRDRLVNWTLSAGKVELNGADAHKFATCHHLTSDFERARRQQLLIWAIGKRAESSEFLPKIPELWGALRGTFSTDLGVLDVIRLVRFGVSLKQQKVTGAAMDQDVIKLYKTSSGASVSVIKDQASLNKRLDEMFAGKPLSDLGRVTGKCPAPPPGFGDPGAIPTRTP
jgi:LCP family protein required for cell wall assembly